MPVLQLKHDLNTVFYIGFITDVGEYVEPERRSTIEGLQTLYDDIHKMIIENTETDDEFYIARRQRAFTVLDDYIERVRTDETGDAICAAIRVDFGMITIMGNTAELEFVG